MAWNPFGVMLEISASAGAVTRTSATQFKVQITASWETYYSGAKTNYGMTASSGGSSVNLNSFGTNSSGKSASFTGTYTISGNASATKSIAVVFRNYNDDNGDSATKTVNLSVSVPAWTSYTVKYDANGGSGAPSSQTKWKDQTLVLSASKPTRTGYSFRGWATSASGSVVYSSGANYTANAAVTLYAVWAANTYTISYNANGGASAPGNQTKTYGVTLVLSSTIPTRTNYNFKGWGTSASATTIAYAPGASYTANSGVTLYAIWELAYTKPRITNMSVKRCDSSATVQKDGTYALVSFSWATDKPVSEIKMEWKLSTSASYTSSSLVSASGNSGSVTTFIGAGGLSATSSYDIRVTVLDGGDKTELVRTLNSISFTMHGKPGGDGVAFGKTSELGAADSLGGRGVADFEFDAKFNQPVYGTVRGLDKLPPIPNGSNFNDYMTPGCWGVYGNAGAETMTNIPVKKAGCLEVEAATGEGVRSGGWSYLRQRYTPFRGEDPVYERDISRDASNVWTYGSWYKATLTPTAASKAYHAQKTLWSGALTMHGGNGDSANAQRVTLSEAVSAQPNGIVLVFSRFVPSSATAENNNFYTFFVPKVQVATHAGAGHTFVMATTLTFDEMASKYLYINDTTISGNDNNALTGTSSSGIKYANNRFVLRYVIGV